MVIVIVNWESAQNQNIGKEKFQDSTRVSTTLKLLLRKNVLFYISAVATTYLHHMAVSIKLCQLNRCRKTFPCLICFYVYPWLWPSLLNVLDFQLSSSEFHMLIFLPLDPWLLSVVLQEYLISLLHPDQSFSKLLLNSHKYCWI